MQRVQTIAQENNMRECLFDEEGAFASSPNGLHNQESRLEDDFPRHLQYARGKCRRDLAEGARSLRSQRHA